MLFTFTGKIRVKHASFNIISSYTNLISKLVFYTLPPFEMGAVCGLSY